MQLTLTQLRQGFDYDDHQKQYAALFAFENTKIVGPLALPTGYNRVWDEKVTEEEDLFRLVSDFTKGEVC